MANPKKPQPAAPTPTPLKTPSYIKTKYSYRVEKISQYEFQAYRATLQENGTYTEEAFGKTSVFTLVMRRVFEATSQESNDAFKANKDQFKK